MRRADGGMRRAARILAKAGLAIVDLPLAATIAAAAFVRGRLPGAKPVGGRSLIFLCSQASYRSLEQTGALWNILSFDLDGYFDRVQAAYYASDATSGIAVDRVDFPEVRPLSRWLELTSAAVYLWKCVGVIRERAVTMIRAADPYKMGLAGLIAAAATGRPVVHSLHTDFDRQHAEGGRETVMGSRAIAKFIERLVLSRTDAVLAVSEELGDKALAWGAPAERVRVVPHGIPNLERFLASRDEKARADLGGDRPSILYVGRIAADKYVEDVVRSAVLVRREVPRCLFLLIGPSGDRAYRAALDKLIADQGLDDHVRFLGAKPQGDVATAMVNADVNVVPYGGYSLIEAAASGTPIVCYEGAWFGRLVRPEESAIVVPYRDVAALATGIVRLLRDPALARRIGERARALAASMHTIEAWQRATIDCYEFARARSRYARPRRRASPT